MLYRVQKRDISRAGKVLTDAFQHDLLWIKICEGEPDLQKRFRAIFDTAIKYCLKYGEVYASSEKLEGVIAWVPGKYADMPVWRMIRSGAMVAAMRMGSNVAKKMGLVFKPVNEDRHEHMAGHDFLYVLVVGVATELQGKGFGRKLIDAAIEKSESERLQLYLETETEENVQMYEHFGFRLLKRVTLPIIDYPLWEMVKETEAV